VKSIASYTLEAGGQCLIYMPAGAQTLAVGAETLAVGRGELRTAPCVYALVEADALLEPRKFLVLPTWTALIADDVSVAHYIGRIEIGAQIFHVFDQQRGAAL
jgi:hypothetical protein